MIRIRNQRWLIIILVLCSLLVISNLLVEEVKRRVYGVAEGVTYEGRLVERLFLSEIYSVVQQDSTARRKWSASAQINSQTGEIVAEEVGEIIDVGRTVAQIISAAPRTEVKAVVYQVQPYPTAQQLSKLTTVIGNFHTIVSGSASRLQNIRVATRKINQHLILPDETFSFNQVVGPRTKERGYKEGPVLYNGTLGSGVGGGVCQVSSTLYNAVLEAKLKIVERYPHSKPVRYVPPNRDAAVAWNLLDFKFHNQYSTPIIIKSHLYGRKLVIKILGSKQD